jgi:diguanylate cyclase (GGDEF)-like protein/PAS domain S-box-containing protein
VQAQETGRFHEALLRYARDIVTVVDEDGTVRYVNEAPAHLLGPHRSPAEGTPAMSYVHPDDLPAAVARRDWLLAEPGRSGTTVVRVRSEGGWRHLESTGVNLLHDPDVHGVLYVSRDVEERTQERAELHRAIAGQRLLAGLATQALVRSDVDALLYDALRQVAELLCAPSVTLSEPIARGDLRLRLHVANDAPAGEAEVLRATLGDGSVLTAAPRPTPYAPSDSELLHGVAEVLTAARRRAESEAGAVTRAVHDALTGLATRPLLDDRLERALTRPGTRCALLLLDLDGFKEVNDSYGHAAGDDVLRALGPRLLAAVRPTDTVARYGGDEFVVLCEEVDEPAAVERIAQRVRRACSQPFALAGGGQVELSGSVGIGWSSDDVHTPLALMSAADAAMYRAKRG